jgi:hypothetical protein
MRLHVKSAREDRPAIVHQFIKAKRTCMTKCESALNATRKYTTRQTALADKEITELRSLFERKCTSLEDIFAIVGSIGTRKLKMGLAHDLDHSIAQYRELPKGVRSGKVRLAIRSRDQTTECVRNMFGKVQNHKSES